MANSVEVTSTGQVVVTEVAEQVIEVTSPTAPLTVEVQTAGPQGPPGTTTLATLSDVNVAAVTNRSTLIYDSATQQWVGSNQTTIEEILNGGNF